MIGVYLRVSSGSQDTRAQEADLRTWAAQQTEEVRWYRDQATGTSMERPGLEKLLADVHRGQVSKVVVWRLDRLGRTARGLLNLFHEWQELGCGFLSLRDALDLSTPAGRLMLMVLAGVAAFETEVRSERQRAGIAAAKAAGKRWGGRKKGQRVTVTPEKEAAVRVMHADGKSISEIARVVGLGRQSIYRVLGLWERSSATAKRSV